MISYLFFCRFHKLRNTDDDNNDNDINLFYWILIYMNF